MLYPENWLPLDAGGKAIDGKFLHDFSHSPSRECKPVARFCYETIQPTRGWWTTFTRTALIDSHQFGLGYVIGTYGSASAVNADGFVEDLGRGESMAVPSPYQDQKAKRGLRK